MIEKLPLLLPEIVLFITTVIVMVTGLVRAASIRKATWYFAAAGVAIAGLVAAGSSDSVRGLGNPLFPELASYAKVLIAVVGVMLVPLLAGTVDRLDEERIAAGRAAFDPLRATRGEFWAFYLFSLTGLMLVASADDLIWLFLALELTSLPTYMMVAISSGRNRAKEAGVKYFFLGALGAAVFLYGFALIYGAAGSTNLGAIAAALAEQAAGGGLSPLATAGLMVAVLGLGFKIAAVPMHFYTADVYEGAASPVSAMLAFVPKAAGVLALIGVLGAAGWSGHGEAPGLPVTLEVLLWIVAALTMTVGNVLAWLQTSVKRMLAYSSIAHSGYMLVGLIAGPAAAGGGFAGDGIAATLFYLLCYGVMNVGTFAVLACLERRAGSADEPTEIDSFDDLRGLCRSHPVLGWTMVLCGLSLIGFPPLLGFFGKLGLVTSGLGAGHLVLVIVLALNSAIAAFYYLRLVSLPLLESRREGDHGDFVGVPTRSRWIAAAISAGGVVTLFLAAEPLLERSKRAASYMSEATHAEESHAQQDHAGHAEPAPIASRR